MQSTKQTTLAYVIITFLLSSVCIASEADSTDRSVEVAAVEMTGSIRVRGVYDGVGFNSPAAFMYSRSRVQLQIRQNERVSGFLQFQDSRLIGDVINDGQSQSGSLENGKNVDVHQAYLDFRDFIIPNLTLRGGRFEIASGNERFLGADDWDNVGRAWEGFSLTYGSDKRSVKAFDVKGFETYATRSQIEQTVFGAQAINMEPHIEALFFYEFEGVPFQAEPLSRGFLDRLTTEIFYEGAHKKLSYEFAAAHQWGKDGFKWTARVSDSETVVHSRGRDLSSYGAYAKVGFEVRKKSETRISLGIDWYSGIGGSFVSYEESGYRGFVRLYGSNHEFGGMLDIFATTGMRDRFVRYGLIDRFLTLRTTASPSLELELSAHSFRTAEDFRSIAVEELCCHGRSIYTHHLGQEIDFRFVNKVSVGAQFEGGVGVFFPNADSERDIFYHLVVVKRLYWAFTQLTLEF